MPLKRYSLPILSVLAATALTFAVRPFMGGRDPLFFFSIAVIVSASSGGLTGGLLATALSVVIGFLFLRSTLTVLVLSEPALAVFALFGAVATLIIEKLHRVNQALALAKNEAEAANRKLSERTQALLQANEELQRFAYSLAHDLNTPLRSIAALTDLLVQRNMDRIDESSKECASLIVSTVGRMQRLIKGLLDYATAVEKSGERTEVDTNVLLARALDDLQSVIRLRQAQITADHLPRVVAVESHLIQVFSNLIGNGIKYCPIARTPVIHVSVEDRGEEWEFCVRDNGIGLDMKYANDIFAMFKRLHGGEYDGTGIGLALCKVVVQRHGGRIWVESEIGKGSRFFFTLPKAPGTPPAIAKPTAGEITRLRPDAAD